jgi:hypothetical protein
MSEIILGTIIGGSIGVIGPLLGFIIQGHFTKNTTKMQINAQTEAARLNRLVEVRAQYLNPLREQVAKIYEQLININDQMINIEVGYGNPPEPTKKQPSEYDKETAKLSEALDKLEKAQNEADIIRSKTSDHRLRQLFLDFTHNRITLKRDVLLLEGIPLKWTPKSGKKIYDFNEATDNLIICQVNLESINGRIEQLLSGGD